MVEDRQVKRLFRLLSFGKTLAQAAGMSGMEVKKARSYMELVAEPGTQLVISTQSASLRNNGKPATVRFGTRYTNPPGVTLARLGMLEAYPTSPGLPIQTASLLQASSADPGVGSEGRMAEVLSPALPLRFQRECDKSRGQGQSPGTRQRQLENATTSNR